MSLTKVVNGKTVVMTADEEAALTKEWADFEAARPALAAAMEQQQFDGQKMLMALAIWTRNKLNALRQDPATADLPRTGVQQRAEILAIFRGLQ
jgi:hypothetical protein